MKGFCTKTAILCPCVVAARQTALGSMKQCTTKTSFIGNASRVHPNSWIPVVARNETQTYYPIEKRWWGTANNMCVSSIQGTWFIEGTPREQLPSFEMYQRSTSDYSVRFGTLRRVIWLTGVTWYANCFKQRPGATHPNHHMMGIARIFAHFGGPAKAPDNIVLHHCSNLLGTIPKRDITSAIWNYGIAHGYLSPETNVITIPYQPNTQSTGYCMTTVEYPALPSEADVLTSEKVASSFHSAMRIKPPAVVHPAAILVRTGGSSLRHFTNMHAVARVIAEVFGAVDIISVNESMTLQAQVTALTSYRLLVTPHGSHITALFVTQTPPVVLEVVATCINRHWAKFTIVCEAGRPVDSKVPPDCNARTACASTANCTTSTLTRLKNNHLHVDLDILRNGLQQSAKLIFENKTGQPCHRGFKYSPFCTEPV